jgi:membrane-anchored glycerophosphoryl diester phosphodiesterase (GDPDase)
MNGTTPTIQIIAPFQAAFEWMKAMLFRPFDLGKWLTVAFAAFIAGSWGGRNFRGINRIGNGDWKYHVTRNGDVDWDITPWIIAAVIGIVVIALVFGIIWMWVSSRGKFIFTDCIVKNRGAIGEPWREYRREGNSFFLFSLLIACGAFVIVALAGLFIWLLFFRMHGDETGPATVIGVIALIVIGLIWLAFALFFGVVSTFMVPVMYRRRCTAREAFADVAKLIFANLGPFILFVLFGIALVLGVLVIGTMLACVTCCVGSLPYISTVLLLPAIVWLATFKLLFIRQFGDQYDVWANALVPAPATLPPTTPA